MIELLIAQYDANPYQRDNNSNTPINVAALNGHTNVVSALVNMFKCNPCTQGSAGRTPLHQACSVGCSELVKLLVVEMKCDLIITDDDGSTPLHIAAMYGRVNLLRELVIQYGSPIECLNGKHQSALHLAAMKGCEDAVNVLISELNCNPNVVDIEGNTPLHYAAKRGNHILVATFLSQYHVSSDPKNCAGHTPLYYAIQNKHTHVVAELVKHNCNPSSVDDEYRKLEESSSKRLLEGSLTKVFVIGNKQAGKSTLVEALRSENREGLTFSSIQKVTPHTAGIVPSVHESPQYGRVLFYDFAGDREYYSSHAAALERLLTSSCHVFLLVLNSSENHQTILQTLGYWLRFVSYNSKSPEATSQVIIVCSHSDIVESSGEDSEEKACELITEMSSEMCDLHPYVELIGYCHLDCRQVHSIGIQKLYTLLKHCHLNSMMEISNRVSVGASILLGVLERDFRERIACQLSEVRMHIEINEIFLPLEIPNVYSYLQELNAHGVIIILGNREGLNEEWMVLDISTFLNTVHKKLFSPASLAKICHRKALSNLGIIAESDLRNVLPDYPSQLLKQCLRHLQYCIEIDDSGVLQNISGGSINSNAAVVEASTIKASNQKLLFFPALLEAERSNVTWSSDQSAETCKGWYVKCCKEYDYFPPRFVHVLLLRLAFSFALPHSEQPSGDTSELYGRRCTLWKNGIQWLMENGVECVVEVVKENKGVVVMVRSSKEFEVECSCVLATIVSRVLEARQEFCHNLSAKFYRIHPDDLKQTYLPSVTDLHLFDMNEVKRALDSGKQNVVSVNGRKLLPITHLQTHNMLNILFTMTTREALRCLEQVVSEWFHLGLELGVAESALSAIEYDHRGDVVTCKRKMVQQWLRQPQPSWCALVEALNNTGLIVAAAKISDNHASTLEVQSVLLDEASADVDITDDFVQRFTQLEAISSRWPLLASLLSFTTAEIEQIKKEVIGVPSVKAAAMMNRWRERTTATYGSLLTKLRNPLEEQLIVSEFQKDRAPEVTAGVERRQQFSAGSTSSTGRKRPHPSGPRSEGITKRPCPNPNQESSTTSTSSCAQQEDYIPKCPCPNPSPELESSH